MTDANIRDDAPARLHTREPTVLPDELLSKIATRKHNPTTLPHVLALRY